MSGENGAGGNSGKGGSSRRGGRKNLRERVKTARGRRLSSTRWLERQLNDPYVMRAKEEGYRSRAAFKLLEMDEKYHFLKSGARIVDLGCAPGGWTQVSVARAGSDKGKGKVIGVDLQEIDPVPGADIYVLDFLEAGADDKVKEWLGGEAHFAHDVLHIGGTYCAKVLQGGAEHELLTLLKQDFKTVRHVKPQASRADSSEMYVLATGFKGRRDQENGADEGSLGA